MNANIFLQSGIIVLVYMHLWFLIAYLKRDNGIVDVAWGLGFVVLAWCNFATLHNNNARLLLLTILATIWGLRLAIHIGIRNAGRPDEDFRYKNWRQQWGKNWVLRSYLQVFLLQGFFMYLIALPLMVAASQANQTSLGCLDVVGVMVFLIGFLFEAIGDYQLLNFKNNPQNKGKIMAIGLWQYTRHPNYFGESVLWWGIFIVSIGAGYWYVSVLSPVVLTWLLTKVSGVPMLEHKYRKNPDFIKYCQQTPAFVPFTKPSINNNNNSKS